MKKKIKKYIKYLQKILENDSRFINNKEYKFKSKLKLIYNNSIINNDNISHPIPDEIDITNIYNQTIHKIKNKLQPSKTSNIQINDSKMDNKYKKLENEYKELENDFKDHLIKEYNYNENMDNNLNELINKSLIIKDILLKLSSK